MTMNYHTDHDQEAVNATLADIAQVELLAQQEAIAQVEAEEARRKLEEELAELYFPNN